MKRTLRMLLVVFLTAFFCEISTQAATISATTTPGQTSVVFHVTSTGLTVGAYFDIKYVKYQSTDTIVSGPQPLNPGITTNWQANGLLPNTVYFYIAEYVYPDSLVGIKSTMNTFTTLSCGFLPAINVVYQNKCTAAITAAPSGTQYTYQYKLNGVNISGATGQSYTTSVSGNYSCEVTNGTCSLVSATKTVTIIPLTVNAITSSTGICKGSSAILSATSSDSLTSFVWTPGNKHGDSITVAPSVTTIYTVTGTAKGCSGSDTVKVIVYPITNVVVTPAKTKVCILSQKFLVNVQPAGAVLSGEGIVGKYFVPSNTTAGDHLITATYTDPNGCIYYGTSTVTVDAVPRLDRNNSTPTSGGKRIINCFGDFESTVTLVNMTKNSAPYLDPNQLVNKATFNDVVVDYGDALRLQTEGGCYVDFPFGLGIDELQNNNSNKDTRVFDILGREVKNPIPGVFYIQGGRKFIKE